VNKGHENMYGLLDAGWPNDVCVTRKTHWQRMTPGNATVVQFENF
jgi:hypothetical protein